MGIAFSFTAKPAATSKRFRPSTESPTAATEQLLAHMEKIMASYGCTGEILAEDSCFRVHFCPQGFMTLRFQGNTLEGECQTNMAGPGFHAAALDFVVELMNKSQWAAAVTDETGYYADRNFERLRQEWMYPWLIGILDSILDNQNRSVPFAVCWEQGDYYPITESGAVITPMGKYSYSDIYEMAVNRDIQEVAREFFIWNEREKDARFFRNCALSLLWHDCRFVSSVRSNYDRRLNERLIHLLRMSRRLDRHLPFPKREYMELCQLAGKRPKSVKKLPDYDSFSRIGYRRGTVLEQVYPFWVPLPGQFLRRYDEENDAVEFYDEDSDGYYASYSFRAFRWRADMGFTGFCSEPNVHEIFRFDTPVTSVKAALYYNEDDGEYNLVAQVICGSHILLCSYLYADEFEKSSIIGFLHQIICGNAAPCVSTVNSVQSVPVSFPPA